MLWEIENILLSALEISLNLSDVLPFQLSRVIINLSYPNFTLRLCQYFSELNNVNTYFEFIV